MSTYYRCVECKLVHNSETNVAVHGGGPIGQLVGPVTCPRCVQKAENASAAAQRQAAFQAEAKIPKVSCNCCRQEAVAAEVSWWTEGDLTLCPECAPRPNLSKEDQLRALLRKYINHVGDCEGIDFIDSAPFTAEEHRLLKEVLS